jgi:cold shock CspA family protein
MQGTIQVYFPLKAYGFILLNFRDRIFFHLCNYKGYIEPVGGMLVNFDIAPPRRQGQREQAVNVIPIEASTEVGGAL